MTRSTARKVSDAAPSPAPPSEPRRRSRPRRIPDGPGLLAKVIEEQFDGNHRRFARHFKVSPATVTRWLNRERSPNRRHTRQLFEQFEIRPEAWV